MRIFAKPLLLGLDVPPIVTHINSYITLDTLLDNLVSIDFDVSSFRNNFESV